VLQAAADHYLRQQQLSVATVRALRRAWQKLHVADLDSSWPAFLKAALPLLVAAQRNSAAASVDYVGAALAEQGETVDPDADVASRALSGVASDGRDLSTLLYSPVTVVKSRIATGVLVDAAMVAGLEHLDRITATQVQDAGRVAAGLAVTVRRHVGYVRMLRLPSCTRCAILAGRYYKWNTGFARHPRCDCQHIPATENTQGDLRTDPAAAVRSGQVTGLSRAETRAIGDGADISQVVNAHRGMRSAQVYGHDVKITSEGMTSRGLAARRLGGDLQKVPGQRYRVSRTPRLMPESIYQAAAGDRDEALRLLRRFGYIT
jgi:hypothetical protein